MRFATRLLDMRSQAGRAVESRWLLLAAILGWSERLECDSRSVDGEDVAGTRQRAGRGEGEFRKKMRAGRCGRRLESTALVVQERSPVGSARSGQWRI